MLACRGVRGKGTEISCFRDHKSLKSARMEGKVKKVVEKETRRDNVVSHAKEVKEEAKEH